MRNTIILIFVFLLDLNTFSQNWMEPVNVSNMPEEDFNQNPDFCFDSNGVIHCVWVHVYEPNLSKIFYTKSYDDGLSWSTGEDISLNDEKRISNPHIVCDSENNLHLTYDHDVGDFSNISVYYKDFNGVNWSDPVVVSENMSPSYNNKLVIDNSDKIYCFWYNIMDDGTYFYRYLEGDTWSEILCPYPGDFYLGFAEIKCDDLNNLHSIGFYHDSGQSHYENKRVYLYFNSESGSWDNIFELSNYTFGTGEGIAIDTLNLPHTAFRQKTPLTGPDNDSTVYRFFNGSLWSTPELVVEDPIEQEIVIDEYNNKNIFDVEKTDTGSMLVHYYKYQNVWLGYIVDESRWYGMMPGIKNYNNKLYAVYQKSTSFFNSEIYLSKSDIIINIDDSYKSIGQLKIFPNPFNEFVRIAFETNIFGEALLSIFTIHGKLVYTHIIENNSAGKYEIIWNGKDQNGKEVKPGLYLVRLRSGRNILTRSVEYIK